MEFTFRSKDLELLNKKGISTTEVEAQLNMFKKGVLYSNIEAPATLNNGINRLEQNKYIAIYDSLSNKKSVINFIPASGAATRMFKALFSFLNDNNASEHVTTFINNISKFSFYNELKHLNNSSDVDIIRYVLSEDGLGYGQFPKGLIPFHKKDSNSITAFEEHFNEAILYQNGPTRRLHFTINEKHQNKFTDTLNRFKSSLETKHNITFEVNFSYQQPNTDTIAVLEDNTPILVNDNLLFRPGGHGALIENLNTINHDIIFIKNIDNVVNHKHITQNANYKKMLAGKLLETQNQIFNYLNQLQESNITNDSIDTIRSFINNNLNVSTSNNSSKEDLIRILNRPIRVCGMVKNEGQPGGGPFWVKNEYGQLSLQIVESAQIDLSDSNKQNIVNNATHFNPVDLVCGVKNYKGEKFNLLNYIDPNAVFIANKSVEGTPIKALERPGLWNGAMANWNTIFVEVPIETFNPVKTVNDLLKPEHQ